ncbi:MAG: response regulator [Magnetococcales bacterium]|nr:response regulator [Magnetococcales bacterium]
MESILVVDDEPQVRNVLKQLLEREGYEVSLADNGTSGLELFREQRPDLLITDVLMPEKSGFQLIRACKRDEPELPVIAITGGGGKYAPELLGATAKDFGADVCLVKPFTNNEVIAAVARLLSPGNSTK